MAWADTLAGLCIANAGVTLPHSLGMAISGRWPHVAHGESLAVVYPAFTRYTWPSAIPQFAAVGRILNPELSGAADEDAAGQCCVEIDLLLKRIGLWISLEGLGVPARNWTRWRIRAEAAGLSQQSARRERGRDPGHAGRVPGAGVRQLVGVRD